MSSASEILKQMLSGSCYYVLIVSQIETTLYVTAIC